MIHSKSYSQIRRTDNRYHPYEKCIYLNDQTSRKKEKSTIFHSPYKNGKKNTDYINPSFVSSDLFYGEDALKPQIKVNVIKDRNQQIKEELYSERMKKLDAHVRHVHEINKEAKKEKSIRRQKTEYSHSRKKISGNRKLVEELNNLISFREKKTKKKQNIENKSTIHEPIYCEKNRPQRQERNIKKRERDLKQWMNISKNIKHCQNENKRKSKQVQQSIVNISVEMNQKRKREKDEESRRNAGLLAQILKEQIKQYKQNQ